MHLADRGLQPKVRGLKLRVAGSLSGSVQAVWRGYSFWVERLLCHGGGTTAIVVKAWVYYLIPSDQLPKGFERYLVASYAFGADQSQAPQIIAAAKTKALSRLAGLGQPRGWSIEVAEARYDDTEPPEGTERTIVYSSEFTDSRGSTLAAGDEVQTRRRAFENAAKVARP